MSIFLKRLELSGFKSFAQKTVLEFPAGVVGIVGPNGSGKSNIVDALRWMMGEREAKQLRGEKIENLIFSGTPKKAALGLAQAALCFDNSSHWLPVDFEEVVLTRKVDRSGVSEFFLNQELVRLKDVIELLAKSRLGTKGFTIVNQGQSDIFVKSSPLERQQMIEEIIGLKEFQLKKSQSEHQLENTIINLEKIKAMVEELQPHLRMLRRQTGKWEKRSEYENELKALENNYFSFKLAEIKNSLGTLDTPLSSLEKEIRQKQKELESFQGELAKLDELKSQTADLLAKRSDCQRELGHFEAKLEILNATSVGDGEVEYRSKDLIDLIKEIKNILESSLPLDQLEKLKTNLENGLERINKFFSVQDKSSEKKEELLKIQEDKENVVKKLESLNADLSQLAQNEKNLIESFKSVEEKRKELNHLENERNKIIFEKEKSNLKFQDLGIQLNQIGRSVKEFDNQPAAQAIPFAQLPEIERKMFKLRTNLASIGDIDQAVVKEAEEAEERYQFLTHQSADLEKASADLKILIKDLDKKIHSDFEEALKSINKEFENYFRLMFGGGKAKLKIRTQEIKQQIEQADEPEEEKIPVEAEAAPATEEAGIDIDLNLPRRRITSLEMLSGGERSLVSMAALFALISVNPPPFLVLDEIDSALDDRNAQRFAGLIKKFSEKTQFIIITHNRSTMGVADVLYGITMGEDGVSKVLSLKLDT